MIYNTMSKLFRNTFDKTYKVLSDNEVQEASESTQTSSKPIHVQRIEKALDLGLFLQNTSHINKVLELSSSSDESEDMPNESQIEAMLRENEPIATKDYYNFKLVSGSRQWLADILQENADHRPEDVQYKHITRFHKLQKQLRNTRVNFQRSMFYGSGLVSTHDQYPEMEKYFPSKVTKKRTNDSSSKLVYPLEVLDEISNEECLQMSMQNGMMYHNFPEDSNANSDPAPMQSISQPASHKKRAKKFKDDESRKKWEELMAAKRRKVFTGIVKKEIGKQHRAKINKHKETLIQCKRLAQHCLKYGRQKALQSARIVKEQQWRMKRLARENIAYWKRSRRFDREHKKRLEKEAEEQRKIDHELIEAKRQQRKLNFLITQTELYAHFMSKKIGSGSADEQMRILSQLDEDQTLKLASDDYDSEVMKEKAKKNALEAFQNEKVRTKHFDMQANSSLEEFEEAPDVDQPQPEIFMGKLKGYQLRGMNWLANLYSQGISGILADEMGLGKTVQSIAFLCHIAEKYSVWGPFLIISPASTLHNWQQEIAKFVPDFKVVPYWGNPNERKILRQFWDQKDIYTKDASFHIVVTSYQIVITDIKYFNRIKWQYMILDEAQAIKSTSSMRWKTLLGFSCRNRLLLSGTPIQNSMAELWALLHFIMPTLFDSHEEFNEWFSKDIESHAENKTGIDEKHLSRLHMILKPFMLRRIKKDVENELSDKIEVMVYCPLTTRQNLLYLALKQKIKIEDLLHYSVGGGDSHGVDKNFTSNLMNLVMQFRKVCNHPELFERRDAKSPIRICPLTYRIPYLVFDYNISYELYLKIFKYFTFTSWYICRQIQSNFETSIFNFFVSLKLSFKEIEQIFSGNILERWKHYCKTEKWTSFTYYNKLWGSENCSKPSLMFRGEFKLSQSQIDDSDVLKDILFARFNTGSRLVYTRSDHFYHSMQETVEHKNIRLKHAIPTEYESPDSKKIIDIVYKERPVQIIKDEKTELPTFLFCWMPKVSVSPIGFYCYSRRATWLVQRHLDDYSFNSLNYYWSQSSGQEPGYKPAKGFYPRPSNAIESVVPVNGWSNITIPDKETLVTDSGKLSVLDSLLKRLKEDGHRVLIYSQMTKMIDLLEEYMWHRHHKYMRLDGSSKISERRDMVADFQARTDIFVFLLSTRAGGLGINLTAADTVIFYDSDWNPTVDQQAMDRAHRLGQTKQVTVYRLICKGSIEERILQRAREKSEIQKLVISGGNFKPDTLKPKEVVSLLLDDDELVQKYHLRVEGASSKVADDMKDDRKRKGNPSYKAGSAPDSKRLKLENRTEGSVDDSSVQNVDSFPGSPHSNSPDIPVDDGGDYGYAEDGDSPISNKYTVYNVYGSAVKPRLSGRGSSRRGRPRGSRSRVSSLARFNTSSSSSGVFSNESQETPSTSHQSTSSASFQESTPSTGPISSPSIRRGPGRPRLKPGGPSNSGGRGSYRSRKPTKPLPVPIPSDGANGTSQLSSGSSYSTYFYDFNEYDV